MSGFLRNIIGEVLSLAHLVAYLLREDFAAFDIQYEIVSAPRLRVDWKEQSSTDFEVGD